MKKAFPLALCILFCLAPLLCFAEESLFAEEPPAAQNETPKKIKPHFAGVRRSAQKKDTRPSTKIRNLWVTSVTHPKKKEKAPEKLEQEEELSSSDLPFFFENFSIHTGQ